MITVCFQREKTQKQTMKMHDDENKRSTIICAFVFKCNNHYFLFFGGGGGVETSATKKKISENIWSEK